MSNEYKIGFDVTEADTRLDGLIAKLNKVGETADGLDRKKVSPVSSSAAGEVDGLKRSLEDLFARQLSQAQQLFASHMERISQETTATSQAVDRLTNSLSKNRAAVKQAAADRVKEAATSENIRRQLEKEAVVRQRMNALQSAAKFSAIKKEPEVFRAAVEAQAAAARSRTKALAEYNAQAEIQSARIKQAVNDILVGEQKGYKQQQAALSAHYKRMETEAVKGRKQLAAASTDRIKQAVNRILVGEQEGYKKQLSELRDFYKQKDKDASAEQTKYTSAQSARIKQAVNDILVGEQKGYKQRQAALSAHYKRMETEAVKGRKQLAAASTAKMSEAVKTLTYSDTPDRRRETADMRSYYSELEKSSAKAEAAQRKLTTSNKSFTHSLHSGAQATAAWRAGLNAAGASIGIFTGQTIAAASATYAAVSAFRASIVAGVEFTDVMARVQAVTGSTAETTAWMSTEAREFAGNTIFTAKEAADALLQLGMAGLSAEESVEAMPATLRLASIGLMSTSEAADLATNVMTQFGMEAKHLTAIVDDLATVANNSNTNISQLGLALSYTGPAAASANVPIQETTAAIGTLASAGIKGSRAGTAMRRVISMLVSPTTKAQKALAKLGVATQDVYGNAKPLSEVLTDLKNANISYGDAVDLVTLRQSQGLLALVNNIDKFRELEEQQKSNQGAAEEFQKTIEDTLGADYRLLVSAAYEKMLQFFTLNEKGFRELVVQATEFVKSIDVNELNSDLISLRDTLATVAKVLVSLWVGSKFVQLGQGIKSVVVLARNLASSATAASKGTGLMAKSLSTVLAVVTRLNPWLLAATAAAGALTFAFSDQLTGLKSTADELERVTKLAEGYQKATEDLTVAQRTARMEAIDAELNQLNSMQQVNEAMELRARLFSTLTTLESVGQGGSSAAEGIRKNIEKLNQEISKTSEKTEEVEARIAELQAEKIKLEGQYVDVKEKVLKTDINYHEELSKRIAKVRKEEVKASDVVRRYAKELANVNAELDLQASYVQKTVATEVDLHNKKIANAKEYRKQIEQAYMGEEGELALLNAEVKKLDDARTAMAKNNERFNAEEHLIELIEQQVALQAEYDKAVEDGKKAEIAAQAGKVKALRTYANGLISAEEVLRRVTAAQIKFNEAVKAAEDLPAGQRVDAIAKARQELLDDLTKAAGTAGEKFMATFLGQLSGLGDSVADAVASGDYSKLGDTLKKALVSATTSTVGDSLGKSWGDSLGNIMGKGISGSFGDMMGKTLGSIGGSIVGGLAGGLVSSLFGGKEKTGEGFKLQIDLGEVIGAQLSESFKKKSIFGSRKWTEYEDMTIAGMESISNSIGIASSGLNTQSKMLGFSLDNFTGTIEEKNAALTDSVNIYSEKAAEATFAAAEKYQQAGQTFAEVMASLAAEAELIAKGFTTVGQDFATASKEFIATTSKALKDGYASQEAELMSAISAANIDKAYQQGIVAEETRYEADNNSISYGFVGMQASKIVASLNKDLKVLEDNLVEVRSRAEDVSNEAVQIYRDQVIDTIIKVQGFYGEAARSQAAERFLELSETFLQNFYTVERQLTVEADRARDAFSRIADMDGSLSLRLDSTAEEVTSLYDSLTDPEQRALVLEMADNIKIYQTAMEELANSFSDVIDELDAAVRPTAGIEKTFYQANQALTSLGMSGQTYAEAVADLEKLDSEGLKGLAKDMNLSFEEVAEAIRNIIQANEATIKSSDSAGLSDEAAVTKAQDAVTAARDVLNNFPDILDEFGGKIPTPEEFLSSTDFDGPSVADNIKALYRHVLGTAPGSDELSTWSEAISSGSKTLKDLFDELTDSGELWEKFASKNASLLEPTEMGDADIIGEMYKSLLGRAADSDGLEYWLGEMESKGDELDDVFSNLAKSDEAWDRFVNSNSGKLEDSAEGVKAIYQSILDRVPSESELEYWVSDITGGQSLRDAFNSIVGSKEAWTSFSSSIEEETGGGIDAVIKAMYQSVLNRLPTQAEIDYWAGDIEEKGHSLEQVFANIMSSSEAWSQFSVEAGTPAEAFYNALVNLQDAEESLTEATNNLSEAKEEEEDSTNDLSSALAAHARLTEEIMTLEGDWSGLRDRQIDALKELYGWEGLNLVALQERVWALQDEAKYLDLINEVSSGLDPISLFPGVGKDSVAMAEFQEGLDDLGISVANATGFLYQLAVSTEDDLQAMAESLGLSADQFTEAVGKVVDGIDYMKKASEDLAKDTFSELEKAIQSEKDTLNLLLSDAEDSYDLLDRSVQAARESLEDAMEAEQERVDLQKEANDTALEGLKTQLEASKELKDELESLSDALGQASEDVSTLTDRQKFDLIAADLESALNAARAGDLDQAFNIQDNLDRLGLVDSARFSSKGEMELAQALAANDLKELKEITDGQLTQEEQAISLAESQVEELEAANESLDDQLAAYRKNHEEQIESLDELLEAARKQLDEAQGIDTSVKSVEEALVDFNTDLLALETANFAENMQRLDELRETATSQLEAALGTTEAVKSVEDALREFMAAIAGMNSNKTVLSQTTSDGGTSTTFVNQDGAVGVIDSGMHGQVNQSGSATLTPDEIAALAPSTDTSWADAIMQDYASGAPVSSDQLASAASELGIGSHADLIDYAAKFETGGMHSGGLRLVGEKEAELEVTGPARYYNQRQMQALMSGQSDSAAVVSAIRDLRGILLSTNDSVDDFNKRTRQWTYQGLKTNPTA